MRLLHTTTLHLEEFNEADIPCYAILSHTWDKEEVTFQAMQDGTARQKAGYKKIASSCTEAVMDGFGYIWIDTCCIDKTSSAELSEAINSMFAWYKQASVCYAYLADVDATEPEERLQQMEKSRWFRRGWTLQELIAPSSVEFYGADWSPMGSKIKLSRSISRITGIDHEALRGKELSRYTVGHRMSWASNRETTRTEDLAYCLLGIFAVNMPLLYGEGTNAFQRLQEAILQNEEDCTIFAWEKQSNKQRNQDGQSGDRFTYYGIFASSPKDFERSTTYGNHGKTYTLAMSDDSQPPTITSRGLHITTLIQEQEHTPEDGGRGDLLAWTQCYDSSGNLLYLRLRPLRAERAIYHRVGNELVRVPEGSSDVFTSKSIYVARYSPVGIGSSIKKVFLDAPTSLIVDAKLKSYSFLKDKGEVSTISAGDYLRRRARIDCILVRGSPNAKLSSGVLILFGFNNVNPFVKILDDSSLFPDTFVTIREMKMISNSKDDLFRRLRISIPTSGPPAEWVESSKSWEDEDEGALMGRVKQVNGKFEEKLIKIAVKMRRAPTQTQDITERAVSTYRLRIRLI